MKSYHPPKTDGFIMPLHDNDDYIKDKNGIIAGFGNRHLFVAQIPRKDAIEIITKHHYSHRIVNNSYIHMGVFMNGDLVGCMQFGYLLNPRAMRKIVAGTEIGEYLELNRMWLSDVAPKNSESQAISYAFKYIKRVCPMVKWVQSFADERCGRLGVVYQASNFLYLGYHLTSFFELDGETYHEMLLTCYKKGGNRANYLRANLHRAVKHTLRQFRYIYFIKPKYRKYLNFEVYPYPKPGEVSFKEKLLKKLA